jgi:hypothetical protein
MAFAENVDDELGKDLASNEDAHKYVATELERVNGELFSIAHATTLDEKEAAKKTLLKNCKELRICSVLNCPEFLDFLTEMYAVPGLRYSAVLEDVAWIKSTFLPFGRRGGESVVAGVRVSCMTH